MSRFIPYLLAIVTVFVFSGQKSYALTDASDLRCRYSDGKGNSTQFFKIFKNSDPLAPGTGTLLSLENAGPLQYHVAYYMQKIDSTSIQVGAETSPEFDSQIKISLRLKKATPSLLVGTLELSSPADNEFYSQTDSYGTVCCDGAYPVSQNSDYVCESDTSKARLKLIADVDSSHFSSDVKVRLIQSLLTF